MKYLITGGAGFIGSHLTERLLELGHEVYILDDLSTGSASNFQPFKANSKFHYEIDSFTNVSLVAELVDSVDIVYHLAAAVGVKLIVESPVRTIETNVRGTEIVLHACARKNRPVFIASTSEVYGKSTDLPFREEGDMTLGATTKGRWAYACSKAIDEFLAIAYWKEKGLPAVVGRLFNTVGPRQTGRYGMVLPNFARQALANEPITVFGDGKQTRCFCHVRDVVEALVALMQSEQSHGEVYNIGGTHETTIAELASSVRDAAGSTSEIKLVSYEEAYSAGFEDMMRRVPSLDKIHAAVGWQPKIELHEIISDVVDWERK